MKTGLKVICCGSRNFWDSRLIYDVLATWKPRLIAHGGANGADKTANEAAIKLDIDRWVFKADWEKYGRAAGPVRNEYMLKIFAPEAVFAFVHDVDRPTRGTADMIQRARKAGVPVMVFGGRK